MESTHASYIDTLEDDSPAVWQKSREMKMIGGAKPTASRPREESRDGKVVTRRQRTLAYPYRGPIQNHDFGAFPSVGFLT